MLSAEALVELEKKEKNEDFKKSDIIKKISLKYQKCMGCGLYGVFNPKLENEDKEVLEWVEINGRTYDSLCSTCKKKIEEGTPLSQILYNKDFIEDFID